MLPLLSGVMLKLLLLVPLFLTTLGLIAGFSLATSKVALLLGGGLSLYYYIRDNALLTPLTKQWGYSHPDPPLTYHPHSYSPPELPEYLHRDRLSVRRVSQ
uniref:Uncharacterized protein n=1 Tax=Graphocephala atropunctata TaxID=36148 RepID=A0A1B6MLW0_9HEMI